MFAVDIFYRIGFDGMEENMFRTGFSENVPQRRTDAAGADDGGPVGWVNHGKYLGFGENSIRIVAPGSFENVSWPSI